MLSQQQGKEYDAGGEMAASGKIDYELLSKLNELEYYRKPFPKSLANSFGVDEVFPIIHDFKLSTRDALRTYVEHVSIQIADSIKQISLSDASLEAIVNSETGTNKLLVTGGGALNTFLMNRLQENLQSSNIEVVVPDALLVNYKEALIMALIGVLRWREEYNVLSTVTGARRSSIGGAVWIGQEA
jgi:anhydro-N-acetylmuramic acid kinase